MAQLLNLLAAIALLVWSTQLVRSAILEGFGANLRYLVARAVAHRGSAVATGALVTLVLQSSTATTLIVSSFVGQGLLTLPMALAVILGADLGTSIAAAVLSLNLSLLSPVLLVAGVVLFTGRRQERAGQIGQGLIGLGLLLLALHLIADAASALTHAPVMRGLLATLSDDVVLAVFVGALLTITAYSSLAIVLLTATLAATQAVPQLTAFALVVGANVGSGLLAVLTLSKADLETRRLPLANLLCKMGGAAAMAPVLAGMVRPGDWLALAPASLTVAFHLAFNGLVVAIFLFQTERLAALVRRLLGAPRVAAVPQALQALQLDPAALASPRLAISSAARVAVHQADVVEMMLRGLVDALRGDDLALSERMRGMDDTVDTLCSSIKHFLTKLPRETLTHDERQRLTEVLTFSIHLEQVADMVEIALSRVEKKKIRAGRRLSQAGLHELCELHARLMDSVHLAVGVFLHRNVEEACELAEMKQRFGELERAFEASHFRRLSERTPESLETSSLHLDLINDLARMNSRICAIGIPLRRRSIRPPPLAATAAAAAVTDAPC